MILEFDNKAPGADMQRTGDKKTKRRLENARHSPSRLWRVRSRVPDAKAVLKYEGTLCWTSIYRLSCLP